MSSNETYKLLRLTLHDTLVGYLITNKAGNNRLVFDQEYRDDFARPTFTLSTSINSPDAEQLMQEAWSRRQKLHPVLSNMLPEGSLRELITRTLKVHIDHEFEILSYLGQDLPGALIVTPAGPDETSSELLNDLGTAEPVIIEHPQTTKLFSLAGVQMKFSMKHQDGRYNLSNNETLGDWIIKTPSTQHKDVPSNEYTAMTLAAMAGIDVPPIKMVELNKLDNLPPINLPDENLAYAIKRFDRDNGARIHIEDFAQVMFAYAHDKYNFTNYEQMGNLIYRFSGDGIGDAQQLARRLLVNILLANGDAHLKNWSLIYSDKITPRLAPAYDIVSTRVYFEDEQDFALNLGKTKRWYEAGFDNFEAWAEHADIPYRAIKPHLYEVMEIARTLWPAKLKELPMNEKHKVKLRQHWANLQPDFRIDTATG